MAHVYSNELILDDGSCFKFSSHWAACAAILRLSDPTFKSLGGDKPEDLAVEAFMRANIAAMQNNPKIIIV